MNHLNNIIVPLLFITHGAAFSQITFELEHPPYNTTFGGWYSGYTMQASDSGYVMAGTSDGIYLAKLNQYGKLEWSVVYDQTTSPSTSVGSVETTNDNGYILAVDKQTPGSMLLKVNSNGSFQWAQMYDGGGSDVIQSADGGYAIAGKGMYLAKLTSNGSISWAKIYGQTNAGYSRRVYETANHCFVLGGGIEGYMGTADVGLVKTDSDGNMLWSKTYGSSLDESMEDMKTTYDGGFIITGTVYAQFPYALFMIKVDSNGSIQWSNLYKAFGGNDYAMSVTQTIDSGFALACSTAQVIKTDKNGIVQWTKKMGKTIKNLQTAYDGGLIMLSEKNFRLIKTDSNGNTNCAHSLGVKTDTIFNLQVGSFTGTTNVGTQSATSVNVAFPPTVQDTICMPASVGYNVDPVFSLYPNPTHSYITIENIHEFSDSEVLLYDLFGRKLMHKKCTDSKNGN